MRRRCNSANRGGSSAKKPKQVKTWDRDVMCLPQSRKTLASNGTIKYPRGKYRSELAAMGLIGKIHLTSEMSEVDVRNEVTSVFRGPMKNDPNFPFVYLQPTGGGSKSLVVPPQSSSFKWNPQQVAKLGGQTGLIYILAQAELSLPSEVTEVC